MIGAEPRLPRAHPGVREPTAAARTQSRWDGPGYPLAGSLLLLRHGQSTSNAEDVFTGWSDVPLTDLGRRQAVQAGHLLAEADLLPTSVHTSLLSRAIVTAQIVTAVIGRSWLPVHRSWRLNERHYGALTGRRKSEVAAEVDAATFHAWRRSYATAPPPMPAGSPFDVTGDPRYAELAPDALPATESLFDVQARLLPYWTDTLAAEVRAGGVPLVVAHGNSLRALVMHLEGLNPQQIAAVDVPTGVPMLYQFDYALCPLPATVSRYLDPDAAAEPVRRGPV
jgi:2,3-bisphosphoglycerate-dependent phosphoglycerate mutase